jgi:hypothetical protein
MLYNLSHASSPVFSGYFENRVSLFPSRVWIVILLFYASHSHWDDTPPPSAFFHSGGVLQTFFLMLAWNQDFPDPGFL